MHPHKKLQNIERDPRVVVSIAAPRDHGAVLNPYAVLRARTRVEPSDAAWDLLNRLTKTYMSSDTEFPAPTGPGYIVRHEIERISGVGPWATNRA